MCTNSKQFVEMILNQIVEMIWRQFVKMIVKGISQKGNRISLWSQDCPSGLAAQISGFALDDKAQISGSVKNLPILLSSHISPALAFILFVQPLYTFK